MAKGFQKVNACSVGDFKENTTRIPKWIINNGGAYSKQVTEETTHLIATEDAFQKNVAAVEKAKELGTVLIVSYDWLSDSLLKNDLKPLATEKYLLKNTPAEEKKVQTKAKQTKTEANSVTKPKAGKGKAAQNKAVDNKIVQKRAPKEKAEKERAKRGKSELEKTKRDKAEKRNVVEKNKTQSSQGEKHQTSRRDQGTKDATQLPRSIDEKLKPIKKKRKRGPAKSKDPFDTKRRTPKAQSIGSNYDIYEDEDVAYNAMLVRPSDSLRGTREIVRLKIFQTITSPHTYATHISWSRLGPSKTDLLAPLGSSLETAMAAFKQFFKNQTGTEWDDRMTAVAPPPKKDVEGNTLAPHRGWFWWDSGIVSLASLFQTGQL